MAGQAVARGCLRAACQKVKRSEDVRRVERQHGETGLGGPQMSSRARDQFLSHRRANLLVHMRPETLRDYVRRSNRTVG